MEDPQNSGKLSDGGAHLSDGENGEAAKRRRSRKGRKKTATGVPSNGDSKAASPQKDASVASVTDASTEEPRKKKRRRGKRRSRSSENNQNTSLTQSSVAEYAGKNGDRNHAHHANSSEPNGDLRDAGAPDARKRRRRRKSPTNGPLGADGCKRVTASTDQEETLNVLPTQEQATGKTNSAAKTRHDGPYPYTRPKYLGQRHNAQSLYAALDLGTNNCRLLIAQPTRHQQFRVVDGYSRIIRLGEGLAATGSLSSGAMQRAVVALGICASKLKGRPVKRMRLIATEACRAADNGEDFLKRVRRETGLELEIINRETEARLAVSSCASLIGPETRSAVLFDIGGGSSEIAVIQLGENRSQRLANHITHWTSLPVGVVTLSERYGGHDVTPEVFEAMVSEVEGMLSEFHCPKIGTNTVDDGFHLIGTSGTVTTLAGVHLDLARYDRRRVDGIWLSDDEVTVMQRKLLSWDFAGRAASPCIGPDRADLVLAGCAILEAIRRRWPSPRMRVADRGLREGILIDMMMRDGVWRKNRRRNNINTGRQNLSH